MRLDSPEHLVVAARNMEQDALTRARCARFVGAVALNPEMQLEPVEKPDYVNLCDAARAAAEGEPIAVANVRTNARIAFIEAIYKAGHVTKIRSRFREDGSVVQHGQSMMNTYRNSLLYTARLPQMRRRTVAETLNGHRIEDLKRAGTLEDYWLFVPSLYPDDMTDEEATENGFFSDTKTAAFQLTTSAGDECLTESAFVAGRVDEVRGRHDLAAMREFYAGFGFDSAAMTATDFLENPLLIHKSLLPNGVVDIVKLLDGLAGSEMFFGQNTPARDYVGFVKECQDREDRLNETVDQITSELISESGRLRSPIDAVMQLYLIVRSKVVRQAVKDTTIDARVFGPAAYDHIEQARQYMERGEVDKANAEVVSATLKAKITMCGIGMPQEQEQEPNVSKDKECDYISKKCPLCKVKNARTHETKKRIECRECKGYVVKKKPA